MYSTQERLLWKQQQKITVQMYKNCTSIVVVYTLLPSLKLFVFFHAQNVLDLWKHTNHVNKYAYILLIKFSRRIL